MVRPVAAEMLGTAVLLAAVVGTGIMGEQLAGGNVALALLANSIATGTTLVALILTFGPISGGHFNPWLRLRLLREDNFPGPGLLDTSLHKYLAHLRGWPQRI